MQLVNNVDEYFLRAKVPMPYLCLVIEDGNMEALPVLLDAVREGDLSLIFKYDNKYNVVGRKISRSALELNKILKCYKFTIVLSQDVKYEITTTKDLLEIKEWMQ